MSNADDSSTPQAPELKPQQIALIVAVITTILGVLVLVPDTSCENTCNSKWMENGRSAIESNRNFYKHCMARC